MSTNQESLTLERRAFAAPARRDDTRPPASISATANPSILPIVVLSTDSALSNAISMAAADRHQVLTVGSVEAAAEMAAAGRCSILITDHALTQQAFESISAPVRAHEPALVTIAVGNRGDDNALIALLSAGAANRLMLKPVTPALARIVIDSAAREHRIQKAAQSRRDAATHEPPAARAGAPQIVAIAQDAAAVVATESPSAIVAAPIEVASRLPANLQRPSWPAVAVALLAVALTVWWLTSRQASDVDPRAIIDANLLAARQALDDGNDLDPPERSAFHYFNAALALEPSNAAANAGIEQIADRYAERARTLLDAQRLAEAALALEKLRRVRPAHPRLSALDTQLRAALGGILLQAREADARAETQAAAPEKLAHNTEAPVRSTPASAPFADENRMSVVAETPALTARASARNTAAATLAASTSVARDLLDQAQRDSVQQSALTPVPKLPELTAGKAAAVPAATSAAVAATNPPSSMPAAALEPVAPKLIRFVPPQYPNEALMHGFEGRVDVGLDITAAGDVIDPRVEDSNRGRLFHRAALAAVKQWKYEPRAAAEPPRHVQIRLEFKRPQ